MRKMGEMGNGSEDTFTFFTFALSPFPLHVFILPILSILVPFSWVSIQYGGLSSRWWREMK